MTHRYTSRICGTGSYVPERQVTNEEVAAHFALQNPDIFRVTGIRTRHWSQPHETCSHLAEQAARRALDDAGLSSDAVDAILVSTTSPDMPFPSVACSLQHRLGAKHVAAFDLAASCSGFLYGLSMAHAFIRSGKYRRCLVVAAEIKSRTLHASQPASGILFGDGAGAVVVTREEVSCPDPVPNQPRHGSRGVIAIRLYSDGACHDLITIPAGGSRLPTSLDTVRHHQHAIHLNGKAVYRVAVKRLTEALETILRETDTPLSNVKHVITHQANGRMLHTIAKRLGVRADQMVSIIDRVGNTSSASLPMALDWAHRQGTLCHGDLVLLGAFGGGFTWGTALVRW